MTSSQSLDDYAAAVAAGAQDPHRGLPDPVFQFALTIVPMINVDLLVQDETGRTLMAWRDDQYGVGWHIPGSIIRLNETFAARIAECARIELRTVVVAEPAPCHIVELLNEGRGHFIALLFRCHLRERLTNAHGLIEADATPRPGELMWCAGTPAQLYPAHRIYRDWLDGTHPHSCVPDAT